jgi:hypothetical protein
MTKKIIITAMLMTVIGGLTLLAGSPFSGSWSSEITFEQGAINPFKSLDSVLDINYSFGSFLSTSKSELMLFGFIWQGFGVTGTLGAFDLQGDVLFGPSTAHYIYGQAIVQASIAGIDFGFYFAQLSNAVLQGPADGFAVRLAGSTQGLDIVSITEFGAQIEDEEDDNFNGITIYHASTGLYKHYVTNPIVVGQGFTGEKVTVSGWSFGCVEDIATTLYMTCAGFDFIKFELTGIDVGLCWLTFDVELTFQTQTKGIVLTPTLVLGEAACIDVYAAVLTNAQDNTIYDSFTSITGISLYGLGFTYSWGGVTITDLTVFNTCCYAITTPEYGSMIEDIAEALEDGHEYYPDYWELLSIEVVGDGCCGGSYTFLANTYFDKNATNLFGWGMTHIEASIPINSKLFLTAEVEVDDGTPYGLDHFGFGFKVGW